MTVLSIVLAGLLSLICLVAGCTLSDAGYAVTKYIQGDQIDKDPDYAKERVYRGKFGCDLMLGTCIMVGVLSGFLMLFLLLSRL